MAWRRFQLIVFLALVIGYAIQAATPLRLQHDSIILLLSAETTLQGGGFLFHGKPTLFPPGYPALLASLMKVHLAYVGMLVCINVLFLLLGFWAIRRFLFPTFLEKRSSILLVCIAILLSNFVIQLVTIPLTDFVFFGISMCCLDVMHSSASSRLTIRSVVISVILVVICICVRRVGIALVPPLLWMVFARPETRLFIKHSTRRTKAAMAFLTAGVLIAVCWIAYRTSTLGDGLNRVHDFGSIVWLRMPIWRLAELGNIAANMAGATYSSPVYPCIGTAAALLVFCGLLSRRKQFGVVDLYFACYVIAILEWPFYALRFWLPVLPLLIAYAAITLKRLARYEVCRFVYVVYSFLFVALGSITLAVHTSISFSGSKIGDVYHTGVYDKAYCVAGFCSEKPNSTEVVDRERTEQDRMDWHEKDGLILLTQYRDGSLVRGNH